ncbi:MAG: WYL domain-containing protein [Bacteroidaceae bacterium]|nr:WYL domain-containing protein [Bacteroidaceae bacterium]
MIQNDLQRLRWQFLDEALRDPVLEFFMGERTATNETGNTRSLIYYVNKRLKEVNRNWSCSKRMLQNDVVFFKKKGARLMPSFRRGHKRILRYINLEWKNPLLRTSLGLDVARDQETTCTLPPLSEGPITSINVRINAQWEQELLTRLQNPEIRQRQTNAQEGTVTIQVKVPMSDDIDRIVLSYGIDIEVLGPVAFRNKIRRTVNEMQKLYKKETSAEASKPVQGDLFGDL